MIFFIFFENKFDFFEIVVNFWVAPLIKKEKNDKIVIFTGKKKQIKEITTVI